MSESGVVEVNGTRLYYESRGTGPVLLLLHGFTLDRRMWSAQQSLSQRYRVVAYDARGFGRSAAPGSTPYRHCDDAAALCEALGLGRVIAIGHSIGAHQLLELALTRPERVAGWVGVCTSGLANIAFPEQVLKLFSAVRQSARRDLAEAKLLWGRGDWFAPARALPELARALDEMLHDYSGWHWRNENPVRNVEPAAAERLEQLALPALVISGGQDLAYNHSVAAELTRRLPDVAALELPAASHMANMEDPDAVNRAVSAFAERVWSSGASA